MSDVRIEKIEPVILEVLKELNIAIKSNKHVLDGLNLKEQQLMRIAIDNLNINKADGVKRTVKFDLEKGQITIEDNLKLVA